MDAVEANTRADRRALVGRNITRAREERALSARKLALTLGMQRRDLRRWETGQHEPDGFNIARIAEVLGKPAPWFYENHDNAQEAAC